MTDREKAIKGLECCTFILGKRKCNECPYQKDNGCYQLQDDFHILLNEQENCENCAIAIEDRQPVIRCKNCIYGDDFDCPAPLPTGYLCQKGHGSHTGDWFCADGKKKEGEVG